MDDLPQPVTEPGTLADIRVGRRLRALRLEAGRSLADVAAQAGISVGALSQIERGVSSLKVRTMSLMSKAGKRMK